MRKKGSTFILSDARDNDLIRAYREIIKKQLALYGRIVPTGIANIVVNSPASRYWVSSERACSVILMMDKGKSIDYMKRNTVRFYHALYKDFCKYRSSHPDMCVKHIVEIIIQEPAPCFAISPRVAGSIIFKMKKKCQQEIIHRLNPQY